MTSITYENIVNVLLETFAEFRDSKDFHQRELEFAYAISSSVAGYAMQRLYENGPDDPVVAGLFHS
jgi:hypothetical protein